MRIKRLIAALLAALMICGGAFADEVVTTAEPEAQATVVVTAPVTLAPASQTVEPASDATEEPASDATEEPASDATEEPASDATEEPASDATEEPAADATEEPAADATEEPASDATEEPAADATEEPAADATEEPASDATEEPAADATEEPAADATEEPASDVTEEPAADATEEPEVYEPIYAWIESDVEAFSDVLGEDRLGVVSGKGVVIMFPVDGMIGTYAIVFDTEDTVMTADHVVGYVTIPADQPIEWLDEAAAEAYVQELTLCRVVDETVVPVIGFEFEPKCGIEEHYHLAECYDEQGEAICGIEVHLHDADCRFAPVVPEPSVEPETSMEPETSVEPEVTAEPTAEPIVPDENLVPAATEEPEPTAEPELNDVMPEVNDEQQIVVDEPIAETVTQDAPGRSIAVAMTADSDSLTIGDTVTLSAELTGYDGLTYSCEWECAAIDENGALAGEWTATGVTELTYSFVADETNLLTAWRLRVEIAE